MATDIVRKRQEQRLDVRLSVFDMKLDKAVLNDQFNPIHEVICGLEEPHRINPMSKLAHYTVNVHKPANIATELHEYKDQIMWLYLKKYEDLAKIMSLKDLDKEEEELVLEDLWNSIEFTKDQIINFYYKHFENPVFKRTLFFNALYHLVHKNKLVDVDGRFSKPQKEYEILD